MSGAQLGFYMLAGVAVLAAIGVVTLRHVMHSALCLAVALMSVAGIFVMVQAEFLAAVQILLYAGGIMVLIVFAIMLIQRLAGDHQPQTNDQWVVALGTCAVLGLTMVMVMGGTSFRVGPSVVSPKGGAAALGELFITKYMIPFEVASVLLLAAMIGVVALAKRER